jgi:hypothetical protein
MSLGLAFRKIGGALAVCFLIVGMAGCGGDSSTSTGPAEEPNVGPGAPAGGKGLPTGDASGKGAGTAAAGKSATSSAK